MDFLYEDSVINEVFLSSFLPKREDGAIENGHFFKKKSPPHWCDMQKFSSCKSFAFFALWPLVQLRQTY